MSVYGTGTFGNTRRFSRQPAWGHYRFTLRIPVLSQFGLKGKRICLSPQPTCFNVHPSGRGPYASASRLALTPLGGTGILNPFAIAYASRPRLRTRLTLFRLTLNRNPWAYGGQVFHLPYRYSYLHFLFQMLHQSSRNRLQRGWNAPLPLYVVESEASAMCLMPENFRCRTARPVSYYALFK